MRRIAALALACVLTVSMVSCAQKGGDTIGWQEQYDLGLRYLSEGNYEEAILAFTAAIEIDPKRAEAYVGLADTYVAQGEYKKAVEVLQMGLEETENSQIILDRMVEIEDMSSTNLDKYVTDNLILEEEFTISNIPFYELDLESAIALLPPSDFESNISRISDSEGNIAIENYSVYRDGHGIITCEQDMKKGTLTGLHFYDCYDGEIIGIETDIRGIVTGDTMDVVLEKIGISPLGANALAKTGLSIYVGANCELIGGYGWIETEERMSSVNGVPAKMINIGTNRCTCQMDFIDDRLVILSVWIST